MRLNTTYLDHTLDIEPYRDFASSSPSILLKKTKVFPASFSLRVVILWDVE
jgi:hypothetical protein